MTAAEKAALAALLIDAAGVLVEFWDDKRTDDLENVTADEAAEQLARWLRRLPGHSWSLHLPQID